MKMLATLCVVAWAAGAAAAIDPGPDVIGVYFDVGAGIDYLDVVGPEVVSAYFAVTNPSGPDVATACYRYRIEVADEDVDSVFIMSMTDMCGVGCVFGGACGDECWGAGVTLERDNHQAFSVWGDALVPVDGAVVLLRIDLLIASSAQVRFYVEPVQDGACLGDSSEPAYVDSTGGEHPLHVASGAYDSPVAEINTGALPTESREWGAVKSLFR